MSKICRWGAGGGGTSTLNRKLIFSMDNGSYLNFHNLKNFEGGTLDFPSGGNHTKNLEKNVLGHVT